MLSPYSGLDRPVASSLALAGMTRAWWIVAAGMFVAVLGGRVFAYLGRIVEGHELHLVFRRTALAMLWLGCAVVAIGIMQMALAAARSLRS